MNTLVSSQACATFLIGKNAGNVARGNTCVNISIVVVLGTIGQSVVIIIIKMKGIPYRSVDNWEHFHVTSALETWWALLTLRCTVINSVIFSTTNA